MHFVYTIQDIKTGKYYTGHTKDIEARLKEHQSGKTRSLRNKGPFKLILCERCVNKSEAIKREKQIKRYKGGRAFKKLIQNGGVA